MSRAREQDKGQDKGQDKKRTGIYVAIGSNLKNEQGQSPLVNCQQACRMLVTPSIALGACSPWYESPPESVPPGNVPPEGVPLENVPPEDSSTGPGPWYVNGVVHVITDISPHLLLRHLNQIEQKMGRVRHQRGESRVIDLDILDYDSRHSDDPHLQLPHPRMERRAFVLLPLADIAPDWYHPRLAQNIRSLILSLPPTPIRKLASDS